MTRLLITRVVVTLIGVAVWGYGQRTDQANIRFAGMAIIAVALLLRFAPARWFGGDSS
jgi:chromate transport protein ChrA